MQFSTFIGLALGTSASLVAADFPKANEYTTHDCSGDLNYGHHTFDLHEITMDDTTHSVYQAGTSWYFFSGKSENGGYCEGKFLGKTKSDTPACLDLDNTVAGERIRCMCNPLIGLGNGGMNSCDDFATE
ncbi:Uu.00g129750.m01.CDS01 [Anthostomella pinea]|uniref:Uu.00g129750.m01.CDS01 n=1 Tax=Anthostomella pinea TaxID=933095 RepID=A0AAI8YI45_9PEZI|nr:Uu.00g129750.m01.CDS01 [Anthostomella pinea]